MRGSGLGLSSSGLEGLDESEKNVVCPADDGVVLPRDRVSMGGGRFWLVAAPGQEGLALLASEEAV